MDTYKNILFATDLSEHCNQVSERAAHISKLFGAKLSIIHVTNHIAGDIPISIERAKKEHLIDGIEQEIGVLATKLSIPKEQQFIKFGSPQHEILQTAQEENIDLIVIGNHEKHGLKTLIKSPTDSVLHNSTCDILAIQTTPHCKQ